MITYAKGSLFDTDADIIVNTVNCVGVMGAGVALAFKQRYPEMFKQYRIDCRKGLYEPGWPVIYEEGEKVIINFPTKDHWRNPSEYDWIENGLICIRDYLKDKSDSVVGLPPLGCGNGGLDWVKVKALIEQYLSGLDAKIIVFEPTIRQRGHR